MKRDDPLVRELREALSTADPRSDCPEEAVWLELVAGRVGGVPAERLREHLAHCADCAAVAGDARRFQIAFEDPGARAASHRRRLLGLSAVAAVLLATLALVFVATRSERPAGQAVERLLAELDLPAPDVAGAGSIDRDLVYRSGDPTERAGSREAALAPYREGRFGDACTALVEHGQRFPGDREGRFFSAVACLEAGQLERADDLLGALAASAGERRDEARELLDRLRRAMAEDNR